MNISSDFFFLLYSNTNSIMAVSDTLSFIFMLLTASSMIVAASTAIDCYNKNEDYAENLEHWKIFNIIVLVAALLQIISVGYALFNQSGGKSGVQQRISPYTRPQYGPMPQ